jgi:DNA topoisomerase-1
MEEEGIGRPSTYVSILETLRTRGYVRLDKKRLIPEDKGRVVTAFLESFVRRYVEYDFTADLEEQLDKVSAGDIDWKQVLRDFWRDFTAALEDVKELRVSNVLDSLNETLAPHIFPPRPDGGNARACPSCANGQLSLKLGKFGSFIGCSNYPDCKYTRPMSPAAEGSDAVPAEGVLLGVDPETGEKVTRRAGRFGPYLQLGEAVDGEKPQRASIPKGRKPEDVTLEEALQTGGRPLGWLMGTAGVLIWLIWKDPAPHWNTVRYAATAVIALAWIVPTYAVRVPDVARSWRWAAAIAIAAMLLLR